MRVRYEHMSTLADAYARGHEHGRDSPKFPFPLTEIERHSLAVEWFSFDAMTHLVFGGLWGLDRPVRSDHLPNLCLGERARLSHQSGIFIWSGCSSLNLRNSSYRSEIAWRCTPGHSAARHLDR